MEPAVFIHTSALLESPVPNSMCCLYTYVSVRILCTPDLIQDALLCRFNKFSLRLLELTKNSDDGSRLLLEGVSVRMNVCFCVLILSHISI